MILVMGYFIAVLHHLMSFNQESEISLDFQVCVLVAEFPDVDFNRCAPSTRYACDLLKCKADVLDHAPQRTFIRMPFLVSQQHQGGLAASLTTVGKGGQLLQCPYECRKRRGVVSDVCHPVE